MVHAYINVKNISKLIRRAGRAGRKSGLCRQKVAQDFSFKIHLFLQNVLQNLVLSTSKSITFGCFFILFLKSSRILVYLFNCSLAKVSLTKVRTVGSSSCRFTHFIRPVDWFTILTGQFLRRCRQQDG
jgi:hypothetical protein